MERPTPIRDFRVFLPDDVSTGLADGYRLINTHQILEWFPTLTELSPNTIATVQGYLLRTRSVYIANYSEHGTIFHLRKRPETTTYSDITTFLAGTTDNEQKDHYIRFLTTNGNKNPYANVIASISSYTSTNSPLYADIHNPDRISVPITVKVDTDTLHPGFEFMLQEIGLNFSLQDMFDLLHASDYVRSAVQPKYGTSISFSPSSVPNRIILDRRS